jgi:hypothetical protein
MLGVEGCSTALRGTDGWYGCEMAGNTAQPPSLEVITIQDPGQDPALHCGMMVLSSGA